MRIDPQLRSKIKKSIRETLRNPENREVTVKSPYKLSDAQVKSLIDAIPQLKEAQIKQVTDESLIGGIVIIDGSVVIDYSIKGRLQEVVDSLLESS